MQRNRNDCEVKLNFEQVVKKSREREDIDEYHVERRRRKRIVLFV